MKLKKELRAVKEINEQERKKRDDGKKDFFTVYPDLNVPQFQIRWLSRINPKWTMELCNSSNNITNSSHSMRPCSSTTSSRLYQPIRGQDCAQQPMRGEDGLDTKFATHWTFLQTRSYCEHNSEAAQTRITLLLSSFCKPTTSYYDVSILYLYVQATTTILWYT